MKIARVRCIGCRREFELWTNEWFCSDACSDAWPADEWPRVRFSTVTIPNRREEP